MSAKVILCADFESLKTPALIGLDHENLVSQEWLHLFCSAAEAREFLKTATTAIETWVASSDDVDAINLAAALKKDCPQQKVYLISFEETGSLKSRAHAAHLDGIFSRSDFVEHYLAYKHLAASMERDAKIQKHESFEDTEMVHSDAPQRRGKQALEAEFGQSDKTEILDLDIVRQPRGFREPSRYSMSETKKGGQKTAYVMTVVSASGGSGKSAIAALSALFAQGMGNNTLLLDADMQFGDMHFLLGENASLTIDDVSNDFAKLGRIKSNGSKPALLSAPRRLEQSEALGAELFRVLDHLKTMFDVIVVNTGAFWIEQHITLLEQSSCSLFVLDQRPSSIRACKHALDLCSQCGIATKPFRYALNRCSRNALLSSIDVSCALQGVSVIELQDGGREVDELLGAGQPLDLIETKNNFCVSLEHALVDVLLPKVSHEEIVSQPDKTQDKTKWFRSRKRKGKVACL